MDEKNKEGMEPGMEDTGTFPLYDSDEQFDGPREPLEQTMPFDSQKAKEQRETGAYAVGTFGEEPPRRKRKKVRRKGKIYSIVYILVVLAVCAVISYFCISAINDVLAVTKPDKAIEIVIPEGATTKEISNILHDEGLIKYPWIFEKISGYENYDGKYAEGEHVLNTNMGYTIMMRTMQKSNQRETVTVTIPEGLPLNKVARILSENGVCEAADFMSKVNSTDFGFDFEQQIPDDSRIFYKMEGYLFPDTYEFYKGDSPLNVIRKMLVNFDSKISADVKDLMTKQGMDLHELLTIASIVQAEAPNVEEMKKVASVYLNRLNDPATFPRLDADPTRDYATEQILGNQGSQEIADAYNTYVGNGLPPGPINNPGLDAIMAVLQPEDTSYYFFCTDLRTGEFYYAETLEEHNQNVQKAGLRQNAR